MERTERSVHRFVGATFVVLALVTSPTLLVEHPRMDVRVCASLDHARQVRQANRLAVAISDNQAADIGDQWRGS